MYIKNSGINYRHPIGFVIDRPRGSGDYLLLITRSNAFFVFDGEREITQKNCVILFKKGTKQLYGATDEEYANDWIHFDMDEEEYAAIERLGIKFDTAVPLNDITELSDFIKSIFKEMHSENIHKNESAKHYLDLFFLKLSEKINMKNTERAHPYYKQFTNIRNDIYLSPELNWTPALISKELNLSRSYTQHLYKLFFGVSIISDVKESRIAHAKELLASTDLSIGEISRSCGYNSDVHFMRIFKSSTGLTPSEMRGKTKFG